MLFGSPIDFQKREVKDRKDDEMCKSNETHKDFYHFFKMIQKCLEDRFRDLDALQCFAHVWILSVLAFLELSRGMPPMPRIWLGFLIAARWDA